MSSLYKFALMQLKTHQGVILYLVFGVLTTLVNILSYWLVSRGLHFEPMYATAVAWVLAVSFAYVTNRKWVFGSSATTITGVIAEICRFFICRIGTGLADMAIMWLFVVVLDFNDIVIKTMSNILVIVMNYLASKFIIFKKSSSQSRLGDQS